MEAFCEIVFGCVWLCVIVWFTLTLNFWYLKLKNGLVFFSENGGWFFLILCYHAKHLQQIHWNKIFCTMYGLCMMLTIPTSSWNWQFCTFMLINFSVWVRILKTGAEIKILYLFCPWKYEKNHCRNFQYCPDSQLGQKQLDTRFISVLCTWDI